NSSPKKNYAIGLATFRAASPYCRSELRQHVIGSLATHGDRHARTGDRNITTDDQRSTKSGSGRDASSGGDLLSHVRSAGSDGSPAGGESTQRPLGASEGARQRGRNHRGGGVA